jgi:hypothetical protein
LEASLELENEPGLVSKVVLVVVARGDVVNEMRQKIIGFYGPDSQVPGDLDIDASTKHQIKGPIAGRGENAPRAIVVDILVKIGMCADDEPLKKGWKSLIRSFIYKAPHWRWR